MKEIILPIGISGSGKSTWAESLPKEIYSIISLDSMRLEFTGDINNKTWDKSLYEIVKWRTVCELIKSKIVVIDSTNLQAERRMDFINSISLIFPYTIVKYKLMELNPELAKRRIKNQIALGNLRANVSDETIDRHVELYKQALIDIEDEPINKFE